MEYIGDIIYDYADGLYINMTNRCPCRCEFCIRNMVDSLGDADSLWLKREPTAEEVISLLKEWDLKQYKELVFCGYGEPMERLSDLLKISRYIKANTHLRIRINTNGLSDLIWERPIAAELEGLIDAVSISLNAASKEKYEALCHPIYGEEAYEGILRFTKEVKGYVPEVILSVVGGAIPKEDVELCHKIAKDLQVKFRVR